MERLRRKRIRTANAVSLVWTSAAVVALSLVSSLAVDLGRLHLVKTELQRVADAAAAKMPDATAARWAAEDLAKLHKADWRDVALRTEDVIFGRWDADEGELDTASPFPDAIRVVAARTKARGDAIPLVFGWALGRETADLTVSATVMVTLPPQRYGIIGIDWVQMGGSSRIDSYKSTLGQYGGGNVFANGSVASNGPITNGGASRINGSADSLLGVAGTAAADAHRKDALAKALHFPAKRGQETAGNDGDFAGAFLASGTYYFHNFTPASTLTFDGPVTVYAAGSVHVRNVSAYQARPSNFHLIVTSAAPVSVGANGAFYGDVYAPLSAVSIGGTGDLYGQVLGRTVQTTGNGKIHYDESMPSAGSRTISLVR